MSQTSASIEMEAGRGQRPSPLELEALKVLWALGSGTVADVRDALEPQRELAYTTVLTLLDRLAGKGAVRREKLGRGYVYHPALSREAALESALERLAKDFFQGSQDLLLAYLQDRSEPADRDGRRLPRGEAMDSVLL
ncbi:MAG: BlaI/MecI/CopY family transcriptional regulator [Bryobacterales bacterium]|nr:BlaI/MecI/CopY family transcriptional regulator [Bryobacterales bacterium]